MKFQGQWMSVDISSSFFPKVVCTSEVRTCSRSSCHVTNRKAPACSVPPSCTSLYPSTACPLHTLHSQETPHTALLSCFVRDMSQEPARKRKTAGKLGHQTQQSQRLHWLSKVCGEMMGSAQHPFSLLYQSTGHARTPPSSGQEGCTRSQHMGIQSNAKAQRVNSQVSRTSSYYFGVT